MVYGVTLQGFIKKRFEDIQLETENLYKGVFGDGVDLTVQGPIGQIKQIMDEREALIWEAMEGLYNSQYPDSSEGISLDNALALVNIERKEATKSIISGVIITGTPGTTIPIDSVASVQGNPKARFLPIISGIIGEDGTLTIDMIAETAGAVAAPVGTLTVIETLVSGWSSITNPNAADIGKDAESDADYLTRSYTEKQQSNAGPIEAIRAALEKLNNVTSVVVIENVTNGTVNSVPAKAIHCVVEGGLPADIARCIFNTKPAGIQAYGIIANTIVDSQGIPQSIGFSRPTDVNIYVDITITAISPAIITATDVKNAIIAYGNALAQGKSVIVYPSLMASMNALAASDIIIKVSKTATPTSDANIAIALNEHARFDVSRITVTVN